MALFKKITPGKLYNFIRFFYIGIFYSIPYFIVGFFLSFNRHMNLYDQAFVFPKMSYYELGNHFYNYEKYEIKLVDEFIKKDDIVLELGGCLGVVSNKINSKLDVKKNHVVLEPNPVIAEYLKENKIINKSEFSIEQSVISQESQIEFNIYKDILWSSSFDRDNILVEKIKVNGISLTDLQAKYKLRFNVLIVDIEGGELELLRTSDFLANFNLLIIEFHGDILGDIGYNECIDILEVNQFILNRKFGNVEAWSRMRAS